MSGTASKDTATTTTTSSVGASVTAGTATAGTATAGTATAGTATAGTATAGTATGVPAGGFAGTPTPVPSAFVAKGKMVMKPSTVTVPATDVTMISADGAVFTITKAAAGKLTVGGVFVVPKIASRVVTALQPAGDSVQVSTEQATPGQVFSDLDVSFDGKPDPAGVRVGDDPVVAAGGDPVSSSSAVDDAAATTVGTTTAVTPTKLRRDALAIGANACHAKTLAFTLTADPIELKPFMTTNADCSAFVLGADIKAGSGALSAAFTLRGNVSVIKLHGHVSAGSAGESTSGGVQLSGALNLTGQARSEEPGGIQKQFKFTWDAIKVDWPVLVGDIPFVIRVGVPIIIEPRFSGGHDIIQGKYLGMSCDGTFSSGSDSGKNSVDTCKLEAPAINSFVNLAPSGFVFAAGYKMGFGPGLVVGGKAIAFIGGTMTAAGAVGVSATGATSTGLLDCIQTDLSFQILVGVEAKLGPIGFNANRVILKKEKPYYQGSRCPNK